jgi:transcriptional regulator with XRE-family HTH domain
MTQEQRTRIFEELRRRLRDSTLTPYEIAKSSGVDRAAISRFLAGRRGLSVESIEKIVPILGIDIGSLSKPAKRPRADDPIRHYQKATEMLGEIERVAIDLETRGESARANLVREYGPMVKKLRRILAEWYAATAEQRTTKKK